MKPKVYIDGQSGTTGLQIWERLEARDDIELLRIDDDKRHDDRERKKFLNAADVAFLCLPDEGARQAVELVENPNTCIIDASTSHRTTPGWVYGYPELSKEQRAAIKGGKRIANPGCHATGLISSTAPLVRMGILPMIAEYEAEDRNGLLASERIYGLRQNHKHLPEMELVCGLAHPPVFVPVVGDFYRGMATTIMLQRKLSAPISSTISSGLTTFLSDLDIFAGSMVSSSPVSLWKYLPSRLSTRSLGTSAPRPSL